MKFKVTERTSVGDVIQERQREYEFKSFEDFQKYLFLSGVGGDTEDIVSDIKLGMAFPEDDDREDDEDGY